MNYIDTIIVTIIVIILSEVILGIINRKLIRGKILITILTIQFIFIPVLCYLVFSYTDYYNEIRSGTYPLPWEFFVAEFILFLSGLYLSITIIIKLALNRYNNKPTKN